MFRRSILELSSRRLIRRTLDASQNIPSLLSVRKEFSTSFQKKNVASEAGSGGKEPKKDKYRNVLIIGSMVAGAVYSAYQMGHLDKYLGKEKNDSNKVGVDHEDGKETKFSGEQLTTQKDEMKNDIPQVQVWEKVGVPSDFPRVETKQKDESDETHRDVTHGEVQTDTHPHQALSETKLSNVAEKPDVAKEDSPVIVQEKHEPETSTESLESKTIGETSDGVQVTEVPTQVDLFSDKNDMEAVTPHELSTDDNAKAPVNSDTEAPSLLNSYHLKDSAEQSTSTGGSDEEALAGAIEDLDDSFVAKDGKLVMSFLQAIHAAEKRQAELDARAFAEEERALKEKYEKELRDARARELMHAEEAAMLDKEIKRERAKAAAAIRTLQEKMEEKLRTELELKESEAEMSIKKLQELAKAELTAVIASEKAAQIEKMAEANLNINALCMAFYARSEEARQIHSVHKLALGAMALEDALSKGLPIERELHALNTYLEGIDKDSLIHLVLSTLPEETRHSGTDTLLQLNQKFKSLKGALRHYVLIPPGGAGLLAHSMAHIASWLRFKEVDPSGDGIESIISRVEGFLAEGKLAEAANALQEGLKGSEAEEIAGDWVRRARNRAITEQALTVLQSYATCISLTQ